MALLTAVFVDNLIDDPDYVAPELAEGEEAPPVPQIVHGKKAYVLEVPEIEVVTTPHQDARSFLLEAVQNALSAEFAAEVEGFPEGARTEGILVSVSYV